MKTGSKGLRAEQKMEFPRAHSCRDLKGEEGNDWKLGNQKSGVESLRAREEVLCIFFFFREGERVRETSVGCLLYMPWPGTEPTTQACTLTGNPSSDL